MQDKVFVDTNVFVYAKIRAQNEEKFIKANHLFLETIRPVISVQVVNEFYSALSRNKIDDDIIQSSIDALIECVDLKIIDLSTIRLAWDVKRKYLYSYYDCLIIASALENHCDILYTEDLQHNQMIYNRLKVINPFK